MSAALMNGKKIVFSGKRIALGGIVHETHGFACGTTVFSDFLPALREGDDLINNYGKGFSPMDGAIKKVKELDGEPTGLIYASCVPSGAVEDSAFRRLCDGLVERLAGCRPDGVLLILHGAMLSEGMDDCEGYILKRVRQAVGTDCPVVAVLDLHANISADMVRYANLLVGYRENPHTDAYDRGVEAAALLAELISGTAVPREEYGVIQCERSGMTHGAAPDSAPAKAFIRLPLLLSPLTNWTRANPLRIANEAADIFREDERIVNITISGGFAYADHENVGVSVLVQARSAEYADSCAKNLADIIWNNRQAASYRGIGVDEAVSRAAFLYEKPVILADMGDNVGGGAPGDGTIILKELLASKIDGALVMLCDGEAVDVAWKAGIDGTFNAPVGGKVDRLHGDSIWIEGRVINQKYGRYRASAANHFSAIMGNDIDMGRSAVVRCGGVTLFLTSRRIPPGDLDMLRHMDIDPRAFQCIAVKSAVAYRDAYKSVASHMIDVNTPGICNCDLSSIPYRRLGRKVYPLDRDAVYANDIQFRIWVRKGVI